MPVLRLARLVLTLTAYAVSHHEVGDMLSSFLGTFEIKEHAFARPFLRFPDPQVAKVFPYDVLGARVALVLPTAMFFLSSLQHLKHGLTGGTFEVHLAWCMLPP